MLEDFYISNDEKKIIYPLIALILLVLIIVIVIIWIPSDKSKNNINVLENSDDYAQVQKDKYFNILKNLLKEYNFENLYEKIDLDWLSSEGIENKEDLKAYLLKNYFITSSDVNIVNSEVFSSDEIYVFKYTIDTNGVQKNVIINETKPFEYTVSFEQQNVSALSNRKYTYESDNVVYDVDTVYVGDNIVQYSINVKNNSEDLYNWIMNDASKVQLVLTGETSINATDITSVGMSSINLSKGGELSFKVTFNIPFEKQSSITSIKFTNLYKNNMDYGVVVLLNGGV